MVTFHGFNGHFGRVTFQGTLDVFFFLFVFDDFVIVLGDLMGFCFSLMVILWDSMR